MLRRMSCMYHDTAFMQVVSGAPLTAFWGATYIWDFINFLVPVAGLHSAQFAAASIVSS